MATVGFSLLQRAIIAVNGRNSRLAMALGHDLKAFLGSLPGVRATLLNPWIAITLYVAVALIWFVPDRRIEKLVD
jgi:hypothetical protein